MKDRQSTEVLSNGAVRYGIYNEAGVLQRYEYIKLEDGPTEDGTAYSKAAVLPDDVAPIVKLDPDDNPEPKDAFRALGESVNHLDFGLEENSKQLNTRGVEILNSMTFNAPATAIGMRWLLFGGGGGGGGGSSTYAGGGGAGGHMETGVLTFDGNSNEIEIVIGAGGASSTDGGTSELYVNSELISSAAGGATGNRYTGGSGGTGGGGASSYVGGTGVYGGGGGGGGNTGTYGDGGDGGDGGTYGGGGGAGNGEDDDGTDGIGGVYSGSLNLEQAPSLILPQGYTILTLDSSSTGSTGTRYGFGGGGGFAAKGGAGGAEYGGGGGGGGLYAGTGGAGGEDDGAGGGGGGYGSIGGAGGEDDGGGGGGGGYGINGTGGTGGSSSGDGSDGGIAAGGGGGGDESAIGGSGGNGVAVIQFIY